MCGPNESSTTSRRSTGRATGTGTGTTADKAGWNAKLRGRVRTTMQNLGDSGPEIKHNMTRRNQPTLQSALMDVFPGDIGEVHPKKGVKLTGQDEYIPLPDPIMDAITDELIQAA